ncbi:MAG: hypothetical protein ACK47E_03595 [Cyclobacteriaceae bacterium]
MKKLETSKMEQINGAGRNSGTDYCINMAATASGALERNDSALAFTIGFWMGKMGC